MKIGAPWPTCLLYFGGLMKFYQIKISVSNVLFTHYVFLKLWHYLSDNFICSLRAHEGSQQKKL